MTTPTKYFHDRTILLLLIINSVIVVTGVLFVLFHLDASKGSTYIVQCRLCDTPAHEFKGGSAFDMSSFVFFLLATYGISVAVSREIFKERRHLSLAILGLTGVLAVFALIVSYSLFSLR